MKRVACAILLLAVFFACKATPSEQNTGDWVHHGRVHSATRYSPLESINLGTVQRLRPVWEFGFEGQPPPFHISQVTPRVIDGIMYLPVGKSVVALDSSTGQLIWRQDLEGGTVSYRGVSFWPGNKTHGPRVFVTVDDKLYAFQAETGEPVKTFGESGCLDLEVFYRGAPTVFEDLLIVGANTLERPKDKPGNTRAYNAITGEKVWEFQTVPKGGELAAESWGDEGWRERSGTNVWAFSMAIDEETGVLYMPVAGPATDHWGGDRPGNNLYSDSLVAVDVRTGEYRWHFQTVHHDLWNFDLASSPALLDLKVGSKKVPALVLACKTGYVWILNRHTGEPVFGAEERPVPVGEVPGEWYSGAADPQHYALELEYHKNWAPADDPIEMPVRKRTLAKSDLPHNLTLVTRDAAGNHLGTRTVEPGGIILPLLDAPENCETLEVEFDVLPDEVEWYQVWFDENMGHRALTLEEVKVNGESVETRTFRTGWICQCAVGVKVGKQAGQVSLRFKVWKRGTYTRLDIFRDQERERPKS